MINEVIFLIIFMGVIAIALLYAFERGLEHVQNRIAAMIQAAAEAILEEQRKQFKNAEGDRTNIESRLHWVKYRQKKLLRREQGVT